MYISIFKSGRCVLHEYFSIVIYYKKKKVLEIHLIIMIDIMKRKKL